MPKFKFFSNFEIYLGAFRVIISDTIRTEIKHMGHNVEWAFVIKKAFVMALCNSAQE